jgi:transmembrane sensor
MKIAEYTIEDLVCDESFQNYCTGRNETDVLLWEQHLQQFPELKQRVEEASQIVSILSARQGNLQQQISELKDGIKRFDLLRSNLIESPADIESLSLETPSIESKVFSTSKRWKIASAIAVAAAACTIAFYIGIVGVGSGTLQKNVHTNTEIQIAGNARKTALLPDGSVITLRENSKVQLSDDFNQQTRELTLDGEAFFDIKHDASKPFIVHTASMDVKVMGTVFNVSAYAGSDNTETSLFRGKVEVTVNRAPYKKFILTPNQKISVANHPETSTAGEVKNSVSAISPLVQDPTSKKASEISWLRNRLEIENEPLEAIASKLSTWYGIHIGFSDETVKKYSYSGTFESENIIKVLEALQLSYPFSYTASGDSIIIGK